MCHVVPFCCLSNPWQRARTHNTRVLEWITEFINVINYSYFSCCDVKISAVKINSVIFLMNIYLSRMHESKPHLLILNFVFYTLTAGWKVPVLVQGNFSLHTMSKWSTVNPPRVQTDLQYRSCIPIESNQIYCFFVPTECLALWQKV